MKVQQRPATARPATTPAAPSPAQAKTPAKATSTGWGPKPTATPAAQAKALFAHLKGPEGAKQASRIIDTIAKKSELARELNWEAANIKAVKPNGDGTFQVDVTFEVLKNSDGRGGAVKHYFGATVNAQGKVLDVPQG